MSAAFSTSVASKTTQTFLTALVSNSLLLGVEIFIFVNLKNRLRRIYTPRTYLPPPESVKLLLQHLSTTRMMITGPAGNAHDHFPRVLGNGYQLSLLPRHKKW